MYTKLSTIYLPKVKFLRSRYITDLLAIMKPLPFKNTMQERRSYLYQIDYTLDGA